MLFPARILHNTTPYNLAMIGPRVWRDVVADYINHLLRRNYPDKRVSLPKVMENPDAHVLLVRGVSWRDDDTFEALEHRLSEDEAPLNLVRFSYTGFDGIYQPRDYAPGDTIADMAYLVGTLDECVRELLSGNIPLNVVAFSLGGLVVANWICRPDSPQDHLEMVQRVNTICLLGVPLFPPSPFVVVTHPILGRQAWYHSPAVRVNGEKRQYDRRLLLSRYPNTLVNVIGTRDNVAPKEYSSLAEGNPSLNLVQELVGANHRRIPRHGRVLELIIQTIKAAKSNLTLS
jgi:pimeloyl-ACP methyl ester carboxylesterase